MCGRFHTQLSLLNHAKNRPFMSNCIRSLMKIRLGLEVFYDLPQRISRSRPPTNEGGASLPFLYDEGRLLSEGIYLLSISTHDPSCHEHV